MVPSLQTKQRALFEQLKKVERSQKLGSLDKYAFCRGRDDCHSSFARSLRIPVILSTFRL